MKPARHARGLELLSKQAQPVAATLGMENAEAIVLFLSNTRLRVLVVAAQDRFTFPRHLQESEDEIHRPNTGDIGL